MRFIILVVLLLSFDLYVFQAFTTVAGEWSTPWQQSLYALFWSIPALLLLGSIYLAIFGLKGVKLKTFTTIRAILMIAYLSKLLIIACLLTDDLRRMIMSLYESLLGDQDFTYGRSLFLSYLGLILGSIPFFTLTYGIIRNPYRYKIFREQITINNLPEALDGLKIVQISDIHTGSFTRKEPVKGAIDLINQQQADLVFFTGDLVNSVASEVDNFLDVFNQIKSQYGVFSILGNHDYGDYVRWESAEAKHQNFEKLKDTHQHLGWDLMMNEHRIVEVKGEKVAVIGVENYSAHPRFPKYGDLEKAHKGTEVAVLKLLLSHDPTHWDDEVTRKFEDIAVTFSGHTHGFQFGLEIPGWIQWSPVKYVYKQWAGLYQNGSQYLYVNRGLGFLGYPGRVGILPEITVIELKK